MEQTISRRFQGIMLTLCLYLCAIRVPVFAQSPTGLQVSLITCGPGSEFIGASFGHTAIRIVDSAQLTDEVYNYGTFDFDAPNFGLRFAQGFLEYYLSRYPYRNFLQEYQHYQRGVQEQILNLSPAEKQTLLDLLEVNLLPQNRGYIYSSVYDNCATRVRDILEKATGQELQWGNATGGKPVTYRQAFNAHLTNDPWQKFGINILSGMPVDQVMSNRAAMYLPRYLASGAATATLHGRPLVLEDNLVLPQGVDLPAETVLTPVFWTLLILAAIILLMLLRPATQAKGLVLGKTMVFISGVLGLLMLVMWFATDHAICRDNLNLLWALPTNLVYPFLKKPRTRYDLLAMALIVLVPVLHLLGVQQFPLGELWPLLLVLFFTFGISYRKARKG